MSKAKEKSGILTDNPAALMTACQRNAAGLVMPDEVVRAQWDMFLTKVLPEWTEDIDDLDEAPLDVLFRLACRYDARMIPKRGRGRPADSDDEKKSKQVLILARVADYKHRNNCSITAAQIAASTPSAFERARAKNNPMWKVMLKDPNYVKRCLKQYEADL